MIGPSNIIDKFLCDSIPNFRERAVHCEYCGKRTFLRKPFCPDCMEEKSPYIQSLLKRVEEHAQLEQSVINGDNEPDLNSDIAKELYWYLLLNGRLHVDRLAQRCHLDKSLVRRYCEAMTDAGILRMEPGGKRNGMRVEVVDGN